MAAAALDRVAGIDRGARARAGKVEVRAACCRCAADEDAGPAQTSAGERRLNKRYRPEQVHITRARARFTLWRFFDQTGVRTEPSE